MMDADQADLTMVPAGNDYPELREGIQRIHGDESVSSLFEIPRT